MTDHQLNFVLPCSSDDELERLKLLDIDQSWQQFVEGTYSWTLQTYLVLKKHTDLNVTISRELNHAVINLGHAIHIDRLPPTPETFLITLQADYRRCPWAWLSVVQNKLQVDGNHSFWMPHWPQPGLVPRDADRREFKRVAFMGRLDYMAGTLWQWTDGLNKLGLEFVLRDEHDWNDFSDIDCVVAIRSFDSRTWPRKPPSKLFNAWHAGVPLIGGNDSAFQQLGSPPLDYIRVTTMEEALQAAAALRDSPELVERIVRNGRISVENYHRDIIARRWVTYAREVVAPEFDMWQKRSPAEMQLWKARMSCGVSMRRVVRTTKELIGYTPPMPGGEKIDKH